MPTTNESAPSGRPDPQSATSSGGGGDRAQVTGRALLVVAALIAAGTAGFELARLGQAAESTLIPDAWRALGLVVFAGLFALVAWRPTAFPGLLELSILHKIAVTLIAVSNTDAPGAWGVAVVEGLIAVALIVGYLLLGCFRAWKPQQRAAPTGTTPSRRRKPEGRDSARDARAAEGPGDPQAGPGGPSTR